MSEQCKDIIPPVEVTLPLLILRDASNVKSAPPVEIPSVIASIVMVFCTVRSLVELPKVKVKSFKFRFSKFKETSLVNVLLSSNFKVVCNIVRVPDVLVKLSPKVQILPLTSKIPFPKSLPPSCKEIIPPVEVILPCPEIVCDSFKIKSASPVDIPSVFWPMVMAFSTVRSLVELPKVNVLKFKFRFTKLNASSLVNVRSLSNFKSVCEIVRVPLDLTKSPPKTHPSVPTVVLPLTSNLPVPES